MNRSESEGAGDLAREVMREKTDEVGDEGQAEELLDVPAESAADLARDQEDPA